LCAITSRAALYAGAISAEIRALENTLKGSSTSFGLDAVSTFGRELEDAVEASNTEQIQRLIDE
jgi:HPt (histidine-containing phosphotransfer) domain-containing protein